MAEIIEWTHRCMIVPDGIAERCRELAATLTPAGAGMWTTPLSPTGAEPATHYISSGLVDQVLADMLESPEALADGTGITLAEAQAILSAADVSQDDPHDAMTRLGLILITTEGP